jgi:cysteinyl-tRNA synthetase
MGWMSPDSAMVAQSKKQHSSYGAQISGVPTLSDSEIQEKIDERIDAKKRKDFKRADEIRKSLASYGIVIEDKPDGTSRWKR